MREKAENALAGKKTLKRTSADLGCSRLEAQEYVVAVVRDLRAEDFCTTDPQDWGGWGDVYAVKNDDGTWYVKLRLEGEDRQLRVFSCHHLEFDIERADGTTIRRQ